MLPAPNIRPCFRDRCSQVLAHGHNVHHCSATPPREIGKSPWCCPRQAEIWRLGYTGWCATHRKLVRLPGVALGWWPSAKTSVAGRYSAVKSQPRKLKGPRASSHSRPVPFQQRTNTPWRSIRSQPAVSRRLFRCLGAHLLRSPRIVKSRADTWARISTTRGHNPPAKDLGPSAPFLFWCLFASLRCRFLHTHSALPFVIGLVVQCFMGKQKALLPVG